MKQTANRKLWGILIPVIVLALGLSACTGISSMTGGTAEAETINLRLRAYKLLYREGMTTVEAVASLSALAADHPASAGAIVLLRDFVQNSQRGIIR